MEKQTVIHAFTHILYEVVAVKRRLVVESQAYVAHGSLHEHLMTKRVLGRNGDGNKA